MYQVGRHVLSASANCPQSFFMRRNSRVDRLGVSSLGGVTIAGAEFCGAACSCCTSCASRAADESAPRGAGGVVGDL